MLLCLYMCVVICVSERACLRARKGAFGCCAPCVCVYRYYKVDPHGHVLKDEDGCCWPATAPVLASLRAVKGMTGTPATPTQSPASAGVCLLHWVVAVLLLWGLDRFE